MARARAPSRPRPGRHRIEQIPLFPLGTVLFPGGRLPLRIFEQRYMEMAKACLRNDTAFGVCLIREGAEVGAPAVPYEVGTLAGIASWDMPQLGVLHIVALGTQRFRVLRRTVRADGLALGEVERLPHDEDAPVAESCAGCRQLLERVIEQQPGLFAPPHRLDSSAWVSARLTELLPLPLEAKQALLELQHAGERLERLQRLLASEAP